MSKKKLPPSKLFIHVGGSQPEVKEIGANTSAHLTNAVIVLIMDFEVASKMRHLDYMKTVNTSKDIELDECDTEKVKKVKNKVTMQVTMGERINQSTIVKGKPTNEDLINMITLVVDLLYKKFGVPYNATFRTVYSILYKDNIE